MVVVVVRLPRHHLSLCVRVCAHASCIYLSRKPCLCVSHRPGLIILNTVGLLNELSQCLPPNSLYPLRSLRLCATNVSSLVDLDLFAQMRPSLQSSPCLSITQIDGSSWFTLLLTLKARDALTLFNLVLSPNSQFPP